MRAFNLLISFIVIFSIEAHSDIINGSFLINGAIDNSFDKKLAVLYVKDDYQNIIYSESFIVNHGCFSFEGNEYIGNFASIIVEDENGNPLLPVCDLLLEPGSFFVTFSLDCANVKGPPLNTLFMDYLDSINSFRIRIAEVEPKWDDEIVIFQNTELWQLYYELGEYMVDYTRKNYMNPLGKALFMSNLEVGSIPIGLYVCENKKEFNEIFSFVNKETQVHPRFISFKQIMEKARATPSNEGVKIDNFLLYTTTGEAKQLLEFVGKKDFLLLEFWASWCGPCLKAIPKLKKIYAEYFDELDIISISLDTNRAVWINALNVQNMPWLQLVELKGFESDISKKIEIKSIPFALLLNKEGIVAADIRSTLALELFLQNQTKKNK